MCLLPSCLATDEDQMKILCAHLIEAVLVEDADLIDAPVDDKAEAEHDQSRDQGHQVGSRHHPEEGSAQESLGKLVGPFQRPEWCSEHDGVHCHRPM